MQSDNLMTRNLEDVDSNQKENILKSVRPVVTACCYGIEESEEEDDSYQPTADKQNLSSLQIETELGLTEDHFSRPEGYFGFTNAEELEMAIHHCTDLIRKTNNKAEQRKLVAVLIQLRIKLQETQEVPEESQDDLKVVLGHHFELRSLERPQQYCEKCCSIIWGVINGWYRCTDCGFKCHSKCLNSINRVCASTKVANNCIYVIDICPEIGLSFQKFRCSECKRKFDFKHDSCLPRQCDYNGQYFCSYCHWNSLSVIPARVVHNWDFMPRKVCRASLQFLRLMARKPILNIESLNPTLFGLVTELSSAKKLREDIITMKQYFLSCHTALEEKLLLELKERQHFVENSYIYSLQDLIDVTTGVLLSYLENVSSIFIRHITQECQGCRGKGFICELCRSDDVIFPFDPRTDTCSSCSSLFHQECYLRWEGSCPKCIRRSKQNSENAVL